MDKNMGIRSIWCAVFFLAVPLHKALGDDPTCGVPPTVDLASLTSIPSSENPVGTTVTYTCQFGYVIEGTSRTLTCELRNGDEAKWSDTRVTCIPRSCGDPGFVTNGHRLGSLFTFPNSVNYECEEGFRLQGNGRRFCQASGSWSGRLPRCEAVSCDPPSNPEKGRVTYVSLEFGSELKFECEAGYALEDTTPVHCTSDGTWSKTDVTCIEKKCEVPQKPEHGSVEFIGSAASPMAGTIAVFTCEGEYKPSGPTYSKCLATGDWTFDAPLCLEPCNIPFVQNGKIGKWVKQSFNRDQKFQEIRVGQRIDESDKFFLHCSEGYHPLGITTNWQAMMTCKDGKWSSDPFCELATCRAEPPVVENGKVEKMDRKHGGTVSYECLSNFKKVKTGNVNCNMGEWKGVPPTCKDVRCRAENVKYVEGVAEITRVTQDGHRIKVRCNEGYEPRLDRQQCSNGEWIRNQESPCKQRDCTVPWILHGHIAEQKYGPEEFSWRRMRWERKVTVIKVAVGSVPSRNAELFLVCDDRYSIQGTDAKNGRIMCSGGRWSPDPVCLRTGTKYTKTTVAPTRVSTETKLTSTRTTTKSDAPRVVSVAIDNKSTTATPVVSDVPAEADPEESYIPPDIEVFEDKCSCEYLPDGDFVAHVDGKEVKIYDKVKNGTVLNIRCKKVGYDRLIGPTEVLCDNCKPWSSANFPTCVAPERGDTIIFYDMVDVSLDGVLEPQKGQALRLFCIAMETAGFPKWRYPNVTGINVTEERRERTEDILYLSHLGIKNITSKYNGYYACAFGIELPTIVQIRVVDPDAHCPRFSIDDEELDVEYNSVDTRVGSKATFSCRRNGQNLNGTSVVTCLNTEEWSSPPPQCIEDCTVPLFPNGHMAEQIIGPNEFSWRKMMWERKVTYRKVGVGSVPSDNATLFLVCDGQYSIHGTGASSRRITCSEGRWIGDPACRRTVTCPPLKMTEGIRVKYTNDRRVDSTVTFNCTDSFVLLGQSTLQCLQTGEWNHLQPNCQNRSVCGPPLNVEGTRIPHLLDFQPGVGTVVNYRCEFGYVKNDSKGIRSVCEWKEDSSRAKWTTPNVGCILATCPQLEITEGITIEYTNERRVNSTATFNCTAPFVLRGQSTLRCLETGEWNYLQPNCRTPGCLIRDFTETAPKNLLPSMEDVSGELQPIGSELSMLCEKGWVLAQGKKATCGPLGIWNFGKARCVVGCHLNVEDKQSKLIIKPIKEYYRFGESVIISCPSDFKLTSDVERVVCVGSEWSDTIPDCQEIQDEYE